MELTSDPRTIMDSLIEEHGLDGAIQVAMRKTVAVVDSFELSVWRDVKRILRERGHDG